LYVAHLSLHDFRSYPVLEVDLEPGVTSFVGRNGQGKTNIVEAIDYLSRLSSHRVAADLPLVRRGATQAVVRAAVVRDERRAVLEVEINPGKSNRARVNRGQLPKARELIGLMRTVIFAPDDLALVKGDPAGRRTFLDDLLVLRAPRYAGVRADYDRVLRQRNALLKSGAGRRADQVDLRTLEVWDSHLATAGAELLAGRIDLVDHLRPLVDKAYQAVAETSFSVTGPAVIDYRSSLFERRRPDRGSGADPESDAEDVPVVADRDLLAAAMLERMAVERKAELDRGISLVGPHRDELVLKLGPLPAKGYASHGESWSFALALRLAAYDLLRSETDAGGEPVLILDDVFAELDDHRRERLAAVASGAEQVLVTAAVPSDVPEALAGARVDVMGAEVRRIR
jgi:DNA replication and repair protein RecF